MKFALVGLATALTFGAMQPVQARPLEVVGTGDGMELVRAIGAAFTAEYPDKLVVVPPSIGSGGGIAAVGAGKAMLARVARPLKLSEQQSGLKAVQIFRLPTAIYVNQSLNIDALSYQQLEAIYEGRTKNWSEVGGPDLRIKVVRREDTDSSLSVLRSSMPGWSDIEITPNSKTAVTTQDAVETVRNVKGAIGFGPYSKVLESSVKVMRIAELHPTAPDYPTAVTVSYVWRTHAFAPNAKSFVEFGKSSKAKALLKALGAVPIEKPILTTGN